MTTQETPKAHLGRNVRHFRLESNMSQEEFADRLGAPWSQKKISQLENRPDIETNILEEIARALKVTPAEIREYSEAPMVNNYQNNYEGSNTNAIVSNHSQQGPNYGCTFNPLDKYVEANDRLSNAVDKLMGAFAKIEKLNEALLKEKEDKILLLERMLKPNTP